jgi:hypothetical protein
LEVAEDSIAMGTVPLTGPAQIIAGGLYVMTDLSSDHPNYVSVGLTVFGLGAAGKAAEIDHWGRLGLK